MPNKDYTIKMTIRPIESTVTSSGWEEGSIVISMSAYCSSSADAISEALAFIAEIDPENTRSAKIKVLPGSTPWFERRSREKLEQIEIAHHHNCQKK